MSLEEEGQTRGMSVTAWIIEHKKKDNLHLERTDESYCHRVASAMTCSLSERQDMLKMLLVHIPDCKSFRSRNIHQLLPGPPLNNNRSLVHLLTVQQTPTYSSCCIQCKQANKQICPLSCFTGHPEPLPSSLCLALQTVTSRYVGLQTRKHKWL